MEQQSNHELFETDSPMIQEKGGPKKIRVSSSKGWTHEENAKLAQYVLHFIDKGYKQTESAYKASAFLDGRSENACSTQWSGIKEDYEPLARAYKDIADSFLAQPVASAPTSQEITSFDVYEFLQSQTDKITRLEIENKEVKDEYEDLFEKYTLAKADLDSFFRLMQQAKDMGKS